MTERPGYKLRVGALLSASTIYAKRRILAHASAGVKHIAARSLGINNNGWDVVIGEERLTYS
jgi:hypothetical protein